MVTANWMRASKTASNHSIIMFPLAATMKRDHGNHHSAFPASRYAVIQRFDPHSCDAGVAALFFQKSKHCR
jgi:hypothetical protein